MTVEKFTQTPTETELLNKIDEIIDGLANVEPESVTNQEIDSIIQGGSN